MGKRVLIVDDERDITDLTSSFLRFQNLDVDVINDSREIETAIQKNKYDLFIIDIMMPHIDGFQAIHLIKALPQYKTTPIIVVSAKSLTVEERKILFENKIDLMIKPYEPQSLVENVTTILDKSSG